MYVCKYQSLSRLHCQVHESDSSLIFTVSKCKLPDAFLHPEVQIDAMLSVHTLYTIKLLRLHVRPTRLIDLPS